MTRGVIDPTNTRHNLTSISTRVCCHKPTMMIIRRNTLKVRVARQRGRVCHQQHLRSDLDSNYPTTQ
jgi:hypothetical protein